MSDRDEERPPTRAEVEAEKQFTKEKVIPFTVRAMPDPSKSDDNVIRDAFGERPKTEQKSPKSEKFDRILENYFTHLNLILTHGSYSDFMYADEIVKMADIKLCIMLSTHPKVSALGSLFNRVVDLIKTTWNATEVEKWAKALDDAVTNLRYREQYERSHLSQGQVVRSHYRRKAKASNS